MSIKLLFCPKSGKILGAQIVGHAGVDKRIDVLAMAQAHFNGPVIANGGYTGESAEKAIVEGRATAVSFASLYSPL